ncbi:hypothetical protein IT41_08170 [Paracoccus halophilus]|uniref:Uncharacterized protein n=2 Tax=Paracoccus halophilus TaxID=376733 RepID=A0A099F3N3_9RHOB|nr:hypothetical protein IT41_08170 [Paracoccus halophilus]
MVGFLLGCLALAALYFILQFALALFDVNHVRFRAPIAVFFLPFIAAFVGLKAGPEIFLLVQDNLGRAGPWARLILIGPVFWAVVVVAYVLVFEPFGYRISEDEWLLVAKIVLFPTAVLWAGVWVVAKFIIGK